MIYHIVAFALLLHIVWWGWGLAWCVTPRRHWLWWPAFVIPLGLALQSAVVWVGAAHTDLAGTQVYARASELLPLLLLLAGRWRARREQLPLMRPARRMAGVGAVVAGSLAVLVTPFAYGARMLTTMSLGSCDAADYAAGARVFMEFSRGDRGGFLGLTEVVRLHSVDNFFDFWLRLNHFTPSALMAFNASVLGRQPHEVVSVLTAVLLAGSVPAVFWMARGVIGHTERASVWIAALYAFNPITWYAVYHVATAQLIAAAAIALLTWAGVMLWRGSMSWRSGIAMSGLLIAAYWLILGAYNFIVLVCLVPAVAVVGGLAWRAGAWGRLLRWSGFMLAPLVVAGAFSYARVAGLVERFLLFQESDLGWPIPAFGPLGWLGIVRGPELHGVALEWHWAGSITLLFLLLVFVVVGLQRRAVRTWTAVAVTLPIFVGYAYLEWRGAARGTNASYDAYKLFAVFYPGILPALCGWVIFLRARPRAARWATGAAALLVTGGVLAGAWPFLTRMANPPLKVGPSLVQLQRIEGIPAVTSLNMNVPDFWERLWANHFLLRRGQYFSTHTYEGRRNTALKGEWDLNGGIVRVVPPDARDGQVVNWRYSVIRRGSPYYLQASLGPGWRGRESLVRAGVCWHWSDGDASLIVENPQSRTLTVTLRLLTRSVVEQDLEVWAGNELVETVREGTDLQWLRVPSMQIPPGKTVVSFRLSQAPMRPGPHDSRLLGLMAQEIELLVQHDPAASS